MNENRVPGVNRDPRETLASKSETLASQRLMHAARRLLAAGCAALMLTAPAAAAPEQSHVRPTGPASRTLLDRGLEQSATLRALVDRLQQTDVVVFVEFDASLPTDLAGGLRFVTQAGSLRVLRISLCRPTNLQQSLQMLGHELQHAIEVAEAREVVDEASLRAFYRGLAKPRTPSAGPERFDTLAARQAGELVASELRTGRRVKR
jgi:hypothetical protein